MYSFNKQLAEMQKLGMVGVAVSILEGSAAKALEIDDSGYLGSYPAEQKIVFELFIELEEKAGARVVFIQGSARTINRLARLPISGVRGYIKKISTSPDLGGQQVTKNDNHQSNGVWFVATASGKLRMWELAVVTSVRDGRSRYYLSLQLVYQANLYQATKNIYHKSVFPPIPIWVPEEQFANFDKWSSLHQFLAKEVNAADLKPANQYRKVKTNNRAELNQNQARIVWFSQSRRYGFAVLADGRSARLHANQVLDQEFPAFETGQAVSYKDFKSTPQGVDLMGVEEIL